MDTLFCCVYCVLQGLTVRNTAVCLPGSTAGGQDAHNGASVGCGEDMRSSPFTVMCEAKERTYLLELHKNIMLLTLSTHSVVSMCLIKVYHEHYLGKGYWSFTTRLVCPLLSISSLLLMRLTVVSCGAVIRPLSEKQCLACLVWSFSITFSFSFFSFFN